MQEALQSLDIASVNPATRGRKHSDGRAFNKPFFVVLKICSFKQPIAKSSEVFCRSAEFLVY